MAKKIDPQAKAKRQKVLAAVLGVVLVGVLAFQGPKTWKMLHPSDPSASSDSPPAATTAPTTGPIAAPTLSGGNVTATAVSSGDGLTDPDAVPTPQSGQLLTFGRFRSKDPFVQQLESCSSAPDAETGTTASCSSGSGPGSSSSGTAGSDASSGASGTSGSGSSLVVTSPPSSGSDGGGTASGAPASARISVNGVPSTVRVRGRFPASDPTFTLVSLTRTAARIAIAGGSFETGQSTVTLTKSKPLTLMNTADGTRYTLRLLSVA